MDINHLIENVTGAFNTDTGKLSCVKFPKYGSVELCFSEGWNIPFAKIKLHTRDRYVDASAVIDDAYNLGQEIAKRWNTFPNQQTMTDLKESLTTLLEFALPTEAEILNEASLNEGRSSQIGVATNKLRQLMARLFPE